MSLVRWDPFRELSALQHSINRLFEDIYPRQGNLTQGWMFPVDIKETPEAILVKAEIPGVSKDDIKVTFDNNVLTIRGERKSEEKEEGTNFLRVERKYGSFSRSFSVDVPVDQEKIKASYKDGVLEVVLPKGAEDSKGVTVEIEG
ncbi:Hsp20/alpha crystallin family protein [Desulforudis sp. 1088]|uniref:Hsp20/alpha crystallin family protein n=1 Tax=unclassified Candidatus Desulforudis TaxID=2635950 RepID=UPI003CE4DAC4